MQPLRIGTRDSQLALWQATEVKSKLQENGSDAVLIPVKSEGDLDLQTPLYEMGVQGIFTRSLDIALLNNKIDVAVHSMKDVPTTLPSGIAQAAVLKRGNYKDLLVVKNDTIDFSVDIPKTIATGSIRRKAQWLQRNPGHSVVNLRGNVNTRMQKLHDNPWDAAIFAAAGLERISLRPANAIELDWMLPAPAQGAIMIVCRKDDERTLEACAKMNDPDTAICTAVERAFLRQLMGGCSMPISAIAEINNEMLRFRGNILSADGRQMAEIDKTISVINCAVSGERFAKELLDDGGREILEKLNDERGN